MADFDFPLTGQQLLARDGDGQPFAVFVQGWAEEHYGCPLELVSLQAHEEFVQYLERTNNGSTRIGDSNVLMCNRNGMPYLLHWEELMIPACKQDDVTQVVAARRRATRLESAARHIDAATNIIELCSTDPEVYGPRGRMFSRNIQAHIAPDAPVDSWGMFDVMTERSQEARVLAALQFFPTAYIVSYTQTVAEVAANHFNLLAQLGVSPPLTSESLADLYRQGPSDLIRGYASAHTQAIAEDLTDKTVTNACRMLVLRRLALFMQDLGWAMLSGAELLQKLTAEGVQLPMEDRSAVDVCLDCGFRAPLEQWLTGQDAPAICPDCGSRNTRLTQELEQARECHSQLLPSHAKKQEARALHRDEMREITITEIRLIAAKFKWTKSTARTYLMRVLQGIAFLYTGGRNVPNLDALRDGLRAGGLEGLASRLGCTVPDLDSDMAWTAEGLVQQVYDPPKPAPQVVKADTPPESPAAFRDRLQQAIYHFKQAHPDSQITADDLLPTKPEAEEPSVVDLTADPTDDPTDDPDVTDPS